MHITEGKAIEIFNLWKSWGGTRNRSAAALRALLKKAGYQIVAKKILHGEEKNKYSYRLQKNIDLAF